MLLAVETPIPDLVEFQRYTDFSFVLAHIAEKYKEYRDFYKEQAKTTYTVTDNSAFELEDSLSSERLLAVAEDIKAHTIIIPDRVGDMEESKQRVITFLAKYSKVPFNLAVVIQGKTIEELIEYLTFINTLVEIDTICIPFDLSLVASTLETERWMLSRAYFIQVIHNLGLYKSGKKFHLLGCSNPLEYSFYKGKEWVTSVDTSSPIQQAVLGVQYSPIVGVPIKLKGRVNFKQGLTSEQKAIAKYNFKILKQWL